MTFLSFLSISTDLHMETLVDINENTKIIIPKPSKQHFCKIHSNLESLWKREKGKKPVILLCTGSLNPVHNMHIRIFELAKAKLEATTDFLVVGALISPSHDQYVKYKLHRDHIHSKHRIELCKLATENSDFIETWSWECEQE